MKIVRFFIALGILNLAACSHSSKSVSIGELPTVNLDSIQTAESLLPHSFNRIAEIPLEANPNSFINFVDQVRVSENGIFILDKRQKSVFRFGDDGTYLSKIHCVGHGPGEYINIMDFLLTDDKVYVLEFRGNILVYDLEGHFIEKIDIPFQSGYFESIGDSKFVFQDIRIDGMIKYLAGIYCLNKKEIVDFIETTEGITDDSYPFMRLKHLWLGSEGVYFNYDYSDIVYKISATEILPVFQYYSSTFPNKEELKHYNANPQERQVVQGKRLFSLTDIFEYDGYIYFSYYESFKRKNAIFSVVKKNVVSYNASYVNYRHQWDGQIVSYNFPGMFSPQENDLAVNPIVLIHQID